MARLARISTKDIPIHIIQRGNNRQVCFVSDDDHGRTEILINAIVDFLEPSYTKNLKISVPE